jgi:hypothetical protein
MKMKRPIRENLPDTDIKTAIQRLLKAEKDELNRSTKASTEPYFEFPLGVKVRNLDVLARLLTGDETCVAICYFKNSLLIASNRVAPEFAKNYISILRQYLIEPFNHKL